MARRSAQAVWCRARSAGRSAAALRKDRFAKLLEDDYAELLKAAVGIWGVNEYRAHVPALNSRERAAPVKKPPPDGSSPNQ